MRLLTILLPFLLLGCSNDVQVAKQDSDGDGYLADVDCDDAHAVVNPDAPEICDGLNNDCDGTVDEGVDATVWYADEDGDLYGDATTGVTACTAPAGYVADATDCDDADEARNPGAREVCDPANVDEDCSGQADDEDAGLDTSTATTWTRDGDGDTYAPEGGDTLVRCEQPTGYVTSLGDCDDANPAISPAATEVCDPLDVDEDCDDLVEDADPSLDTSTRTSAWRDADEDSYGDPATPSVACDVPAGYVTNSADCDDTRASVSPAGLEVCDPMDLDEDCDGLRDDADPSVAGQTTTWADRDHDFYGDAASPTLACDPPPGNVLDDQDCVDTDAAISPAAAEVCDDGIDNDCDGTMDEGCGSCGGPIVIDTLGYDGMDYYPLNLDDCLGIGINCCSGTTTQEEMDAFCILAGYCEAVDWVVQTIPASTTCYCWGACTGDTWYSPCCSGVDDRRQFVTSVTCE